MDNTHNAEYVRRYDGENWPYVQDLAGVWHQRPHWDEWVRSTDGPNAKTLCGQEVMSVHVSSYVPRCEAEPVKACACLDAVNDSGEDAQIDGTGVQNAD